MSTPVQRQYWELKNQNPDAMLFFRLGDFYELFYEDAQVASRILGIALTARHKGTDNEMPMCGFPYHSHEPYLEQLVEAGYKVAIAEQNEVEPGKIVRQIDRVVTPGTSLEEGNTEEGKNNFLLALGRSEKSLKGQKGEKSYALAYSDLGTGEFRTANFRDEISFLDEVWKLNPKEVLIQQQLFADEEFCAKLPQTHITVQSDLNLESAENLLKEQFGVSSLDGFGLTQISLLVEVSGLVVKYLSDTQKTELTHIKKIVRYSTDEYMQLDAQTFQHLEIFRPIYGDDGATLFSVFEKSCTAMGGRKLYQWVGNPLLHQEKILERHEAVEELVKNLEEQKRLKEILAQISDLERLLARFVTGKGNGRDLVVLRNGISVFGDLQELCKNFKSSLLNNAEKLFSGFEALLVTLQDQVVDTPPLAITEGSIIRDGVSEKLDELRSLSRDAETWLEQFLESEKEKSGISNVRVKYSKNFGFCLEVSKAQAADAPESWVRRQTLVNAERFTTPELSEYENKVLGAESEAFALEHEMFLQLRELVLSHAEQIQVAAQAVGEIDGLLTFARTAQKHRWCKPEIIGEKGNFQIQGGRHPVVEKLSEERFIANDLGMETSHFHLITGPNMAGKSTFLRQNAVIILLAQIGSFVPAEQVQMPIFDRIFTRVGASDNLAGGKSTFYVEMAETAKILNLATDRSFVILDEIGRGTSTFDGLSLAWAITEYLHDAVGCRTLFATHYHELIDLGDDLSGAANYHVSVSQNKDGIVFLRKIREGGIADSFGIEVAKSAGVPASVIDQAREVLIRLESENLLSGKPNLFSTPRVVEKLVEKDSAVEKKLSEIDPDQLSPKEALEVLYDLKSTKE